MELDRTFSNCYSHTYQINKIIWNAKKSNINLPQAKKTFLMKYYSYS